MTAVKSTVAVREAIIARAQSQLGVSESPAYSNRTPYSLWYGMIGPWCAMFVSWCLYFAGLPLHITTSKGFAYVPYGVSWFKARGAYADRHVRPERGWIVFFDFIGRPSHVGIVEGVHTDGRIITLEGNTNASGSRTGGNVMRHYRSVSGGIIGYGIIDYQEQEAPVIDKEELGDMDTTNMRLARDNDKGHWFATDGIYKKHVDGRAYAGILISNFGAKAQNTGQGGHPDHLDDIVPFTWPKAVMDQMVLIGDAP